MNCMIIAFWTVALCSFYQFPFVGSMGYSVVVSSSEQLSGNQFRGKSEFQIKL